MKNPISLQNTTLIQPNFIQPQAIRMSMDQVKNKTKALSFSKFGLIGIGADEITQLKQHPQSNDNLDQFLQQTQKTTIAQRLQNNRIYESAEVPSDSDFKKDINFSVYYEFNGRQNALRESSPSHNSFSSSSIKINTTKQRNNNYHPSKGIQIEQVANFSKEQNSPIHSESSDDLDFNDRIQDLAQIGSFNVRGSTKIRDMSTRANTLKKDSLLEIKQNSQEQERRTNVASPFKMSQQIYRPSNLDTVRIDLEKSILGTNMPFDKTSTNLMRQSISKLNRNSLLPIQIQNNPTKLDIRILEEFFIIGVDKDKVKSMQLKKESPLEPENLFMFNEEVNKTVCQRRAVVKDFCFPNGVQISKLQTARAERILYSQQNYNKENCFVFTLQAQDMDNYDPHIKEEFFYCMCLIFEEIIEGEPNEFYSSQKAFCIMSQFRYYDLHLSILNTIMSLYKNERYEMLARISMQKGSNNLQNEIKMMAKSPLLMPEVLDVLNNYNNIDPISPEIRFVNMKIGSNISFKTPQSVKQQQQADMIWYASMFLSAINGSQFIDILCAIMLEKSVIFVSDNLPLLSSAVLGMQCFLNPFKWCHVAIPVLPKSLLDIIEAPMPFLVGLLKSHVKFVPSLNEDGSFNNEFEDQDIFQERLVVMIDDENKNVAICQDKIDLPKPDFHELEEKVLVPFSIINNSMSYTITPNDKQKQALIKIQDCLLESLNEHIANNLPQKVLLKQQKHDDPKILANYILQNSRPKDIKFMQQFVNSQMLIHYLEQKYCI
eukprot:403368229